MKVNINRFLVIIFLLNFTNLVYAQVDSTFTEEEDYSMYDDVEDIGEIKIYCRGW